MEDRLKDIDKRILEVLEKIKFIDIKVEEAEIRKNNYEKELENFCCADDKSKKEIISLEGLHDEIKHLTDKISLLTKAYTKYATATSGEKDCLELIFKIDDEFLPKKIVKGKHYLTKIDDGLPYLYLAIDVGAVIILSIVGGAFAVFNPLIVENYGFVIYSVPIAMFAQLGYSICKLNLVYKKINKFALEENINEFTLNVINKLSENLEKKKAYSKYEPKDYTMITGLINNVNKEEDFLKTKKEEKDLYQQQLSDLEDLRVVLVQNVGTVQDTNTEKKGGRQFVKTRKNINQ